MTSDCVWIAAGYPVLVAAIGVLWTAYTKSERRYSALQEKRLEEKESRLREFETLRHFLERHRRKEGGPLS